MVVGSEMDEWLVSREFDEFDEWWEKLNEKFV
jgi:hypothetical protein